MEACLQIMCGSGGVRTWEMEGGFGVGGGVASDSGRCSGLSVPLLTIALLPGVLLMEWAVPKAETRLHIHVSGGCDLIKQINANQR